MHKPILSAQSRGWKEREWPYFIPRLRDLAPSDLPPPILDTRSTMACFSAIAGEFEWRWRPTIAHAKGAKDGNEDWLLEIRIGNCANDAGRVTGSDRVGGEIFRDDGAGADDDSVTQCDTLKNDGAGTNKTAAADFDRL